MKLGIQLWSVRNEANADFKGTVEKLKAMGYEGVEIAGISSLDYFEMAEVLKQVGITARFSCREQWLFPTGFCRLKKSNAGFLQPSATGTRLYTFRMTTEIPGARWIFRKPINL